MLDGSCHPAVMSKGDQLTFSFVADFEVSAEHRCTPASHCPRPGVQLAPGADGAEACHCSRKTHLPVETRRPEEAGARERA